MLWTVSTSHIRRLAIFLLVLGIIFRFAHLDRKIYWRDETFTSLRVFGYSKQEISNQVTNGQIITTDFWQSYQKPDAARGLPDTIKVLAMEDPKHPPLYFILTRLWTMMFGDSVAAIRSFSAFTSLLIIPCLYWLCLELFSSPFIAWLSVALVAVSPFQIIYAQEARMYALHMVTVLLSSAVLLRAIRKNSESGWATYAATITLGLYTHTIFSLLLIIHCIYVFSTQAFKSSRIVVAYLLSSLAGFALFFPWLLTILSQLDRVQATIDWVHEITLPLEHMRDGWEVHFGRLFLDITPYYKYANPIIDSAWRNAIRVLILIFLYSVYFLIRKSETKISSFMITFTFFPALFLVVPDLAFGGIRSIQPRYLLITYLGCYLSFGYLFGRQITIETLDRRRNRRERWKYFWALLFVIFISMSLISCAVSFATETWWSKGANSGNLEKSEVLNQTTSLLIAECNLESLQKWDGQFGDLISLSYHLSDRVKYQCFNRLDEMDISEIPDGFEGYFLLNPPTELIDRLKPRTDIKIEEIGEKNTILWKLEK